MLELLAPVSASYMVCYATSIASDAPGARIDSHYLSSAVERGVQGALGILPYDLHSPVYAKLNAERCSSAGTIKLDISLRAVPEGAQITLSIRGERRMTRAVRIDAEQWRGYPFDKPEYAAALVIGQVTGREVEKFFRQRALTKRSSV